MTDQEPGDNSAELGPAEGGRRRRQARSVPALPGGLDRPTLYDVARLAGVSTATVSRVIHNHDRVRDTTRSRVQGFIDQLGYIPDGSAQSLSRRRKEIIGLLAVERILHQFDLERVSLLFYDEVLHGVESELRRIAWSLLISFLEPDEQHVLSRIEALAAKVDGLLVGEGVVQPAVLARVAQRIPVVVIAGAPEEQAVDVVSTDNRSGSTMLGRHLIDRHGRRRIFYVDGPSDAPDARERRLAIEDVVRARPEARIVGVHPGNFSVQGGEQAGADLITEFGSDPPDCVICANDQTAIGVIQALKRSGIRVPEQVSVVGFDDIYLSRVVDPPLTTVHQPIRRLGERGCVMLLERIENPALPARAELLPTELVLRRSCGCPGPETRSLVDRTGTSQQAPLGAFGSPS